MVDFEISINGHPMEPFQAPELGTITADLTWMRIVHQSGKILERAKLFFVSTHSDPPPGLDLNVGDEITIRIVRRQENEAYAASNVN